MPYIEEIFNFRKLWIACQSEQFKYMISLRKLLPWRKFGMKKIRLLISIVILSLIIVACSKTIESNEEVSESSDLTMSTLNMESEERIDESSESTEEIIKPSLPIASIPDGIYESGQSVELNAKSTGVDIFYTLDGSIPTEASTKYAGSFKLPSGDVVVKAVAISPDGSSSDIATYSYTFKLTPNEVAHQAYYVVLTEYTKRLGICYTNTNDSINGISGVSYARLIDFDNDGIDELYLHWFERDNVGYDTTDPILTEEIWGIIDGRAKMVYSNEHTSQDQHISSGSNVDLCTKNGHTFIKEWSGFSTGAGDFSFASYLTVEFRTYKNGQFNTAIKLTKSVIDYTDYSEYDGKIVYKSELLENGNNKELDLKVFDTMNDANSYQSINTNDFLNSYVTLDNEIITGGSYQVLGWKINDVSKLIEQLGQQD